MDAFTQGNVPWLALLQGNAFLLVILTIVAIFFSILAWKNHYWNSGWRIIYSLTTPVALAQAWFLITNKVL